MKIAIFSLLMAGCSQESITSYSEVKEFTNEEQNTNYANKGGSSFNSCAYSGSVITITSDAGDKLVLEVPAICNPNYQDRGDPETYYFNEKRRIENINQLTTIK